MGSFEWFEIVKISFLEIFKLSRNHSSMMGYCYNFYYVKSLALLRHTTYKYHYLFGFLTMLKFTLLLLNVLGAFAAKSEDLITSLPGLSQLPSYKQYSGYLDATSTKHLHYWFVESQRDPTSDPVVLWLNGGPGCSSLDGLLSENGPLHVRNDGETLYSNPYSWSKLANVLYLESPAGVGYSYDDNGDLVTDDDKVSLHNYQALVDFFKKFPEFIKNPFFVTGESYGGIYIPTLCVRIMQGAFKMNFKGFSVGNGVTKEKLLVDSAIFFSYYHGIFGLETRNELTRYCCNGTWGRETCNFYESKNHKCQNLAADVSQSVYVYGLNSYAIYRDCSGKNGSTLQRYQRDISLLLSQLKPGVETMISNQKINAEPAYSHLPCLNTTASTSWLNNPVVRKSLHIPPYLPPWSVCSDTVKYTRIYYDMTPQYKQLLKDESIRILVYNGDVDLVCNFLGDQWFVDDLNLPVKNQYSPWYVEGQVAGFVKTFDRITYATVRGAGHMVPQWAPKYAYVMFDNFINDKPFNV